MQNIWYILALIQMTVTNGTILFHHFISSQNDGTLRLMDHIVKDGLSWRIFVFNKDVWVVLWVGYDPHSSVLVIFWAEIDNPRDSPPNAYCVLRLLLAREKCFSIIHHLCNQRKFYFCVTDYTAYINASHFTILG